MLGSGLLALPWSIAQMGWIAGPLALWSIAVSTCFTALLLADTYRFQDPALGKRLYTYVNAVKSHLGWYSASFQYCELVFLLILSKAKFWSLFGTLEPSFVTIESNIICWRLPLAGYLPGQICAWTQNAAFIGCGISYIITASNSMV
jgi:hypothetical protein